MCFHGRLFPEAEAFVLTLFAMLPENNLPSKRLVKWAEECAEAEGCRREADI